MKDRVKRWVDGAWRCNDKCCISFQCAACQKESAADFRNRNKRVAREAGATKAVLEATCLPSVQAGQADDVNLQKAIDESLKEAAKAGSVQAGQADDVNLQKAVDESLKEAAKAGRVQDGLQNEEAKQRLFHSLIKWRFNVKSILRDGNCLFRSFVAAQKLYNGEQLTVQELRNSVATHLIQKIEAEEGIPHAPYSFFEKNHEGEFVLSDVLQGVRGEEAAWKKSQIDEAAGGKKKKKSVLKTPSRPTLHAYANKIKSGLFGGDLELYVLASLYSVTFHIYSWHYFDGERTYDPQKIGDPEEPAQPPRRVVSLLFEQDFSSETGGRDHYELITSTKFSKWKGLMSAMPKWKVDIGPCYGRAGRGIKALRDFKKGDVLLFYDGHRVDDNGNVVIERKGVKELYEFFAKAMSAEYDQCTFVKTHAVCLGRVHSTGLAIDGFPLTLACFDNVAVLGRGALANSASLKDSNMRMIWIEAPDLPPDFVDHLRDCEAFLIARRDIACVNFIIFLL
jgi:hypothetical protein